ncbi:MAG: polysaccharide lyase [Bacteroidota bacterium]
MSLYINMYKKGKRMVFTVLLFGSVVACQKTEIENPAARNPVQLSGTTSANLLYEETFEGSDPFGTYVSKQFGTSHAFSVVGSPVFAGAKAGRFELRDTDPLTNSGTRAEVSFPRPDPFIKEQWYSFSVYFPSSDYKYDSHSELIWQLHQGGGVSPSAALETRADRYRLIIRPTPDVQEKIDMGAIKKDTWNTVVFHYIHSSSSDGLVEMWLNNTKVLNRPGRNMYTVGGDFETPKPKLGIYKWDWNGTETTDVSKRILFFDNIRIGKTSATYNEMVAGGSTIIAPAPTAPVDTPTTTVTPVLTGGIKNFTLVNAGTERDVLTITEGATISLQQLGLIKTNIRANPAVTCQSIKFVLTGPQSRTYVDNVSPYALMGDDSYGNYYFGIWGPPVTGSYTLTATPYSGEKATGTMGAATTLHFTITK